LVAGPQLSLDMPALIDEFDARLESAIAREQLPQTVGLPVSSGRDSRSLGLVLLRDPGRRVETMTFGTRGSRDLRGGRAFAERYGLPHHSWPYRRQDLDLARAARRVCRPRTASRGGPNCGRERPSP
jgi:asparagine synthetase B (glutamine-hydrolysing)